MKWVHPAWKTLGIEPTSDTRAIRVAYSAKLKAIDPDKDPQAFIALREAFEAAKVQAQWVDLPDEEEDEDLDDENWEESNWAPSEDLYQIRPSDDPLPSPVADPTWQTPEPASPTSPWVPITPEQADAHARALATLLYSRDPDQPWPTPEQEAEMLAHWRAITADPRMEEVAYYDDAERWFGELIASTAAFSDPLVAPATEFFGWLRSDGTITQSQAVAYVTRRYRMLDFQQAVKQPKHPLNAAWRELVRPADEKSRRGAASAAKVAELLGVVRRDFPDLEGCFDSYRVALWEGSGESTSGGGGFGSWWIYPLCLFILVRVVSAFSGGGQETGPYAPPASRDYSPPVAYAPPMQMMPPEARQRLENAQPITPTLFDGRLEKPDPDLDQALQSLFGDKLDIATITFRDPELHKALKAFWAREQAAGVGKMKFAEDLRAYLIQRYPPGPPGEPPRLFD